MPQTLPEVSGGLLGAGVKTTGHWSAGHWSSESLGDDSTSTVAPGSVTLATSLH